MRRTIKNKRILLTGASSGIGAALAVRLAQQGAKLVLLARREDRLKQVACEIVKTNGKQNDVEIIVGDVVDPDVRQCAVQTVLDRFGGLDIVVNNAGAGATARVEDTTRENIRRLFEVNYFATIELIQLALPHLKKGNEPMIVNLSSIVGLRGVPHYGVYGSAKAAVANLSDSLRAEVKRDGIGVLLVCPGTTQTEFFDVLYQASSAPDMPVHAAVTPDYVAVRILRAMETGKHKIIPYFPAKILDSINRFCPRFVDWLMTKYV